MESKAVLASNLRKAVWLAYRSWRPLEIVVAVRDGGRRPRASRPLQLTFGQVAPPAKRAIAYR